MNEEMERRLDEFIYGISTRMSRGEKKRLRRLVAKRAELILAGGDPVWNAFCPKAGERWQATRRTP